MRHFSSATRRTFQPPFTAAVHADKLQAYSPGGGPQDPRNGWKKEIKAALDRALRLVQKRLKGQKADDYLEKIKDISDKSGVPFE